MYEARNTVSLPSSFHSSNAIAILLVAVDCSFLDTVRDTCSFVAMQSVYRNRHGWVDLFSRRHKRYGCMGSDACSGVEAFCRGEEDGLMCVKKVRFVLWMLHGVPMGEMRSKIERVWAVKSLGQSRSAWCILRKKALWVASGNGDGRSRGTMYGKELVSITGTRLS